MKIGFTFTKNEAREGFTLIELLVVISIIGILAALTLTGFNAARKNARDAQRKSDLGQYRVALEAYASNNKGMYPNNPSQCSNGPDCGYGESCYGEVGNGIFQPSGGPLIPWYLPAKISDPLAGSSSCPPAGGPCGGWGCGYIFRAPPSDRQSYVLEAPLETGGWWQICSNGKAGKPSGGTPFDWNCDL